MLGVVSACLSGSLVWLCCERLAEGVVLSLWLALAFLHTAEMSGGGGREESGGGYR
jgi:hypothetical protein